MRVFVDTSIFLSAALFPAGRVAETYAARVESGHEVMTSDYVLDELRQVVSAELRERITPDPAIAP